MTRLPDDIFMQEAINLAKKGIGKVSPNPLVGAVVVKNQIIIGSGYHEIYGEAHAEVNAINNCSESVEGSTLYCNLEPCCHIKKQTPPCAQMLITRKIKKVVIATLDPNPMVSGKGVALLREAGIEVVIGILEKEANLLNEVFFYNVKYNLPFIRIKLAQTLDGKIATHTGDSKWISSTSARTEVHNLRLKYDSVMIGRNTLETDNAKLSIRMGINSSGKQPFRIIIGNINNIDLGLNIFTDNNTSKNIIVTSVKNLKSCDNNLISLHEKLGTQIVSYDKSDEDYLKAIFKKLYTLGINSILLEGGAKLITDVIGQNLTNKCSFYICPILLGSGLNYFTSKNIESMKNALTFDHSVVRELDGQAVMDVYPKMPDLNQETLCLQV